MQIALNYCVVDEYESKLMKHTNEVIELVDKGLSTEPWKLLNLLKESAINVVQANSCRCTPTDPDLTHRIAFC